MPREVTVRDGDETFTALLFEGANNKFEHRGDHFARVAEKGGDRTGWVEVASSALDATDPDSGASEEVSA